VGLYHLIIAELSWLPYTLPSVNPILQLTGAIEVNETRLYVDGNKVHFASHPRALRMSVPDLVKKRCQRIIVSFDETGLEEFPQLSIGAIYR